MRKFSFFTTFAEAMDIDSALNSAASELFQDKDMGDILEKMNISKEDLIGNAKGLIDMSVDDVIAKIEEVGEQIIQKCDELESMETGSISTFDESRMLKAASVGFGDDDDEPTEEEGIDLTPFLKTKKEKEGKVIPLFSEDSDYSGDEPTEEDEASEEDESSLEESVRPSKPGFIERMKSKIEDPEFKQEVQRGAGKAGEVGKAVGLGLAGVSWSAVKFLSKTAVRTVVASVRAVLSPYGFNILNPLSIKNLRTMANRLIIIALWLSIPGSLLFTSPNLTGFAILGGLYTLLNVYLAIFNKERYFGTLPSDKKIESDIASQEKELQKQEKLMEEKRKKIKELRERRDKKKT